MFRVHPNGCCICNQNTVGELFLSLLLLCREPYLRQKNTKEETNCQATEQLNEGFRLLVSQKDHELHFNAAMGGFVAVTFQWKSEALPCEWHWERAAGKRNGRLWLCNDLVLEGMDGEREDRQRWKTSESMQRENVTEKWKLSHEKLDVGNQNEIYLLCKFPVCMQVCDSVLWSSGCQELPSLFFFFS